MVAELRVTTANSILAQRTQRGKSGVFPLKNHQKMTSYNKPLNTNVDQFFHSRKENAFGNPCRERRIRTVAKVRRMLKIVSNRWRLLTSVSPLMEKLEDPSAHNRIP